MSVYVRTSRRTGISLPWPLAIFVGIYVGLFWLVYAAIKWSFVLVALIYASVLAPAAAAFIAHRKDRRGTDAY